MKDRLEPQRREPLKRIKDFFEVSNGFSKGEAVIEASRCLQCKKPLCVAGCPVKINIPLFIKKISENDFNVALDIIKDTNSLPAICGRVCPQEEQCEEVCVLAKKGKPIAIGYLERAAADYGKKEEKKVSANISKQNMNIKIAVIGSGPAGLTAAGDLIRMGYRVTVFEALHKPGGVLIYGIPEFRLPKYIVEDEIEYLRILGVEFKTGIVIGKTFTIDELFKVGYKAIFIGTGAGLPRFLNIHGENLIGVYSANEYLTRVNLMRAYEFPKYDTPILKAKNVAVFGGGNVAMDSARTALRLGAKNVYLVYRRSKNEMPARIEEIENGEAEGIKFIFLASPIKLIGDENNHLSKIICIRMELGEPDASQRRRPIPIKNSEFSIEVETAIVAIGNMPNPLLTNSAPQLRTSTKGTLIIDKNHQTSIEGIFAGGDITTGAATVIKAMGAGKDAAISIDKFVNKKSRDS